jgi:hypothetical protein
MKTPSEIRLAVIAFVVIGTALTSVSALAQVESLNPNPTLPAGVGSAGELEKYHHGTTRGTHMGREIGGRLNGAEMNPADIMLRELGGTHSGRHTGHALIRGEPVHAAQRIEAYRHAQPFREANSVYFARRGDYENAIYAPQHGSYRQPLPHRTPAMRTRNRG